MGLGEHLKVLIGHQHRLFENISEVSRHYHEHFRVAEDPARVVDSYLDAMSILWRSTYNEEKLILSMLDTCDELQPRLVAKPLEEHQEVPEVVYDLWAVARSLQTSRQELVKSFDSFISSVTHSFSKEVNPDTRLELIERALKIRNYDVHAKKTDNGKANIVISSYWPDLEAAERGLIRSVRKPCCVVRENFGPEAVQYGGFQGILAHPPKAIDRTILDRTHPFCAEVNFCSDCGAGVYGKVGYSGNIIDPDPNKKFYFDLLKLLVKGADDGVKAALENLK